MRILITPRFGADADDAWYPWLTRQLGGVAAAHQVMLAPLKPNARAPAVDACVAEIARHLGGDVGALADTLLVGHSVGCQASLRYLETLGAGQRVAGLVCVAGWWWLDAPAPGLQPWLEAPMRTSAVREATERVAVLLSDDDPHSCDVSANRLAWELRLSAQVTVVAGAGHFDRSREPAVLEVVRSLADRC